MPLGEPRHTCIDASNGKIHIKDHEIDHQRFTAREYETSFMNYYRSRYYNNRAGSFLSKDKYKGNYKRPLSINRYLYVEGNPVNSNDPYGYSVNPELYAQQIYYVPVSTYQIDENCEKLCYDIHNPPWEEESWCNYPLYLTEAINTAANKIAYNQSYWGNWHPITLRFLRKILNTISNSYYECGTCQEGETPQICAQAFASGIISFSHVGFYFDRRYSIIKDRNNSPRYDSTHPTSPWKWACDWFDLEEEPFWGVDWNYGYGCLAFGGTVLHEAVHLSGYMGPPDPECMPDICQNELYGHNYHEGLSDRCSGAIDANWFHHEGSCHGRCPQPRTW